MLDQADADLMDDDEDMGEEEELASEVGMNDEGDEGRNPTLTCSDSRPMVWLIISSHFILTHLRFINRFAVTWLR